MAKGYSKKKKKSSFYEGKSLVGLSPDYGKIKISRREEFLGTKIMRPKKTVESMMMPNLIIAPEMLLLLESR